MARRVSYRELCFSCMNFASCNFRLEKYKYSKLQCQTNLVAESGSRFTGGLGYRGLGSRGFEHSVLEVVKNRTIEKT